MNYLAHCFLSGPDEHLLVGNFIADHVKGKDLIGFPAAMAAGIVLHRKIDRYTDTHPVVKQSKKRLRPFFHKYSPVVADMYYDHFLAKSWNEYSEIPLAGYAQQVYSLLQANAQWLPERTKHMIRHMIAQDWLTIYASLDGMDSVLRGMATRTRFFSNMEEATGFLQVHYSFFEKEFKLFFPDLIAYVNEQPESNAAIGKP